MNNEIFLLKLIKPYPHNSLYRISESNFPNAQLLLWFLQDFACPIGIQETQKLIDDTFLEGFSTNACGLDKKENGVIAICYLYDDTDDYAELQGTVLLKIMEAFWLADKQHPQEIIIKFDENDAILEIVA